MIAYRQMDEGWFEATAYAISDDGKQKAMASVRGAGDPVRLWPMSHCMAFINEWGSI
jgi:hypothetical protein